MDAFILGYIAQDGLTTGAIYALVALAIVLVFAVTRVIFVSQGDFVTLSALTLATLESGVFPGTFWFLAFGSLVAAGKLVLTLRSRGGAELRDGIIRLLVPVIVVAVMLHLAPEEGYPFFLNVLLTMTIVVPMGPIVYSLVFEPVSRASVLNLFIISVALHIVILGLSLWMFGAEGFRVEPLIKESAMFGGVLLSYQGLLVVVVSILLILILYLIFARTIYGKALQATAFNQTGAQLVGVSYTEAGKSAFLIAAAIGTITGVLISSLTTLYYDSGFLISLKGFVAAIIGGLASYPLAAVGAFGVGLVESVSSFWASAFKEVIVFSLIIPVLIVLSLKYHGEEKH